MTQSQFKKEFANLVQARLDGVSKKDAAALLDDLVAHIASQVQEDRVVLPGLGIFTMKETPARTGRNPRTGEPIEIEAGKKVVFRPSKSFKEVTGTLR